MNAASSDEADATPSSIVADVLVPVAVDTAYSYRVPAGLRLEPGQFVAMPLGTRIATGVVWATRAGGGDNLKSIVEVRDWPPLRKPLRDFIDWVARWTLSPRGGVLRMAVRAPEATAAPPPKWGFRKTGKTPDRPTVAALARSRGSRRRLSDREVGAGRRRGLRARRHRRSGRRRRAGSGRTAARAGRARSRSGVRPPAAGARSGGRRRVAGRRGPSQNLRGLSARGRHGLGQDGGLFRGRRGSAPNGPPIADPDAGNRADRAIPRPIRGAFRGQARRMAFRDHAAPARAPVGRGGFGRGARGRRARVRRCSCRSRTSG